MPKWVSVRLSDELSWTAHGEYLRSAIVDEARKVDSSAFAGRNLTRVFNALHTQSKVFLEPVMVLIDVPRERIILAAFPGFLGDTIGSGVPIPTVDQRAVSDNDRSVRFVGADDSLRAAAAIAAQRVAEENSLRSLRIEGPDGRKWSVYLQQISARPEDLLETDGHTLTQSGAHRMAVFVRGVVLACREWIPERSRTALSELEIQVKKTSPANGPTLQESLAPADTEPPQLTPRGSAGRPKKSAPTRTSTSPEPGPGWHENDHGDEQWWDGNQWGPYPPPPRVQTVYTVPHPESKSLAVAYLLFFSLGWYGAHRFYLGNTGHGVGILLTGLAASALGILDVVARLDFLTAGSLPPIVGEISPLAIILVLTMILFLAYDLIALPQAVVNHNTPLMTRHLQAEHRHTRRDGV